VYKRYLLKVEGLRGKTIEEKKKKKLDDYIILSFVSERIDMRIEFRKKDHGQCCNTDLNIPMTYDLYEF